MKNKHYVTLLFAALLSPVGAAAQSWTPPTIMGQELETDATLYLYNVKAGGFLNQNSSSQTAIKDEGKALYITTGENDTYLFGSTTDEGATYTYMYYEDFQVSKFGREAGGVHINWTIEKQSDGTYFIRPDKNDENYGEDYYPEMYFGWDNDNTGLVYPLIDGYDDTYGVAWKFVGEEEYNHFFHLNALNKAMTECETFGLEYASALTVYNNAASTNEELAAATAELNKSIRAYKVDHASLDAPVELSDILANYNFEEGFESGSFNIVGWTQEPANSFTYDYSDVNGEWTNIGRWAFGDSRFTDAKIYQTMTDAPNGKYELRVWYTCIDQEPANPEEDGKDAEDYSVTGNTLYATTTLGTSTFNLASMSRWGCAEAVITFFVTDGKLEVGVDMKNSTANWFRLSDIKLTYYGNDAIKDELQTVIDRAKAASRNANKTYLDNIDKLISEAEALIANDGNVNDMTAKAEALNEAINDIQENIDAYVRLNETYQTADKILSELEGEVNDDIIALSDYMSEIDIEDIIVRFPYTTEQLEDIIAKMELLTQSAEHSLVTEDTDVTEFIANASFTDKETGWVIETNDDTKIKFENGLMALDEFSGEVRQTLLGMPNGVYELTVQGFQRSWWNFEEMDEQWANGEQDALHEAVHSYLFLNDGEQRMKHSFDDGFNEDFTQDMSSWDIRYGEKSQVMMPNTTGGANQYFEKGYFKNSIQAFVIDGTLTFGIRNYGDQGAHWGCYDNFTLHYIGKDLEKALTLLQQKVDNTKHYLDKMMSSDIKTKIEQAHATANDLLASGDEADFDAVIDAVNLIQNAIIGADESIESFKALVHANEVAAADLAIAGVAATESGKKLQALYDANKSAASITPEEIDNVVAQYLDLGLKAKIEKGIKADDDLTHLLVNPSYEDQYGLGEGVSGVFNAPFGWTFMINDQICTKAEDMNAAGLNNFCSPDKNVDCTDGIYGYCLQTGSFPDVYMYQTINGLPAGTYKVTVDMVVPNDNDNYRLAGQRLFVNNHAMYYGYEDEYDLDALEEGHPYEVERTFGDFDEVNVQDNGDLGDKGPLSTLEVIVTIGVGEPLQLGVRTDGHWEYTYKSIANPDEWNNHGWCKFDNMRLSCVQLTYPDAVEGVNTDARVVSEEFYGVDGIKLPKAQKGVNIVRQTLNDGSVVTKKVIIK